MFNFVVAEVTSGVTYRLQPCQRTEVLPAAARGIDLVLNCKCHREHCRQLGAPSWEPGDPLSPCSSSLAPTKIEVLSFPFLSLPSCPSVGMRRLVVVEKTKKSPKTAVEIRNILATLECVKDSQENSGARGGEDPSKEKRKVW